MRKTCTWIVVGLVSGCTSNRPPENTEYAEIDVTVAAECKEPSAFVRELHGSDGQKVKARRTPVRVRPGVYSIGVSCGTIFNSATATCVDAADGPSQSDVAPYELVLRSKRRYVFSCSLVKEQNVIRLSESAL